MTKPFVYRSFWEDVAAAISQRELAWQLYVAELAEQRRTSGLGIVAPFVSVLVHVIILGSVMAIVFAEPIDEFLPFFAVSFAIWQAISIAVSQFAYANEHAGRYLHFPNLSGYLVHLMSIYQLVVALLLKLVAALAIIAVVNPAILLQASYAGFLFGLLVIGATLFAWALPMAFLFDRIRLLRGFLPQMLFAIYLLTPILWNPSRLEGHMWIVELNPVYHLIELARAPMLNGALPIQSVVVAAALCAAGTLLSLSLFGANRRLMVFRWMA